MPKRECLDCRRLIDSARGSRCAKCKAKRATSGQRGYGSAHARLRAKWKPHVDALEVTCWRCGQLIIPDPRKRGDGWHLGHDDIDRTRYRGPEHEHCNVGAPRRGKRLSR